MQTFLHRVLVICLVALSSAANGETIDAIAVWAEYSDEKHKIFISEYVEEDWAEPSILLQSKNKIIAPAVGSASLGAKQKSKPRNLLVVWTEVIKQNKVLKYMSREEQGWSPPEYLTELGGENLSPSIVHDLNGSPWVFWTSTALGNDDIYMTRKNNGQWTAAKMVNDENKVPDILPIAELNRFGNVLVNWQSLDMQTFAYSQRQYTFPGKAIDVSEKIKADSVFQSTPLQALNSARVNLHFPQNTAHQSTFFRPSLGVEQ